MALLVCIWYGLKTKEAKETQGILGKENKKSDVQMETSLICRVTEEWSTQNGKISCASREGDANVAKEDIGKRNDRRGKKSER